MAVPFLDIVRQTRKGAISEALNDALAQVNAAVNATGKPGSVTLTLTVARQKGQRVDATNPAVDLKFAIKSKLPVEELPQGIAFLTGDNDLVRNDPDQQQLFREAGDKPGDRRDDSPAYIPPVRGAG